MKSQCKYKCFSNCRYRLNSQESFFSLFKQAGVKKIGFLKNETKQIQLFCNDMDSQDRKITKVMVTTNSLYCFQGKLYVSKINSKLNSKL